MARRRRARSRKKATRRRKPKLGSGARFRSLNRKLASRKGVRNSRALAASIGRKKFGRKRYAQLSAQGRRRAARRRRRRR